MVLAKSSLGINKFNADNFRVLVGDREEYVPGPTKGKNGKPSGPNTYDYKGALLNIIPNAQVTVEKGVGHYIFDHVDSNGRHAITREILLTAGLDPSLMDKKQNIQDRSMSPNTDSALQKYASDPFFRSWVQKHYRSSRSFFQMIRKRNETLSMKILKSYEASKKAREAELNL